MGIRSRGLAVACAVIGIVAVGCTPPTGGTDTTPPKVLSIEANPASATPGSTVTLSAHVTDSSGTSAVVFQLFRPGTAPVDCVGGNTATRTDGSATDGTWSRTC